MFVFIEEIRLFYTLGKTRKTLEIFRPQVSSAFDRVTYEFDKNTENMKSVSRAKLLDFKMTSSAV